jgi:hypothetical protein
MSKPLNLLLTIVFLGFASPCVTATFPIQAALANPLQSRMLADITFIEESFDVKYAPAGWKSQFCGWTLKAAAGKVKTGILNNPKITLKEYQMLLKEFFNSVKDYHVGVVFYSTEASSLPFVVKKAEEKYYIAYIDSEKMKKPVFSVGDEIVSFDGKPIEAYITELKKTELGNNTAETDQALAELTLTNRSGQRGHTIPKGDVKMSFVHEGKTLTTTLKWDYIPEKITQTNSLGLPLFEHSVEPKQKRPALSTKTAEFFNKMMLVPYAGLGGHLHAHSMGAKQSYLPAFGNKIWQSEDDSLFDAYIFELPGDYGSKGPKNIGYIRIAHYVGDKEDVDAFKEIMLLFKDNVDGLIIDQLKNPGGSVFYLYALASLLTDRALAVPMHHIALTQQEVYLVATILDALKDVKDDATAVKVLGADIGGYPVDYAFAVALEQFCESVLQEWNEGHHYTKAVPLFGVRKLRPDPQIKFKKPIVILTNSLDFSGGDFFPAIMQDNKRALIFGTRTAGAGGYVVGTQHANRLGIAGFTMTGSLAERENKTMLENLGVKPDVPCSLTKKDLQSNYSDFRHEVLKKVESLL